MNSNTRGTHHVAANRTATTAAAAGANGTSSNTMMAALSKQGVGIHQLSVPKDLFIPTSHNEPSIKLKAGQVVLVIKTPKGIYLRMNDKIIKLKQHLSMSSLFGQDVYPESLSDNPVMNVETISD